LSTLYVILSFICLLTTVLSGIDFRKWWSKFWDINRVHIAGLAFICIVLSLFLERNHSSIITSLIGTNLICLVYHIYIIRFFFPFYPKEISDTSNTEKLISLVSINVRKKNKKYNNLISLVKKQDPDLLLLTEVDHGWIEHTLPRLEEYTYRILQPQENTYGIALFSKYKLVDSQVKFLVEQDVPSIYTNILFRGVKIQFLGLHPKPPAPWNKVINKDLELIKVAALSNFNEHPTIVSGDLNDVGWSKITNQFKTISGLLDPRIGRGFFNTYNALIPILRVPIDHFFISKHFKVYKVEKLKNIGSDHFPVMLMANLEVL